MRLNKTSTLLSIIATLFMLTADAIPGTSGFDHRRFLPLSSRAFAGEIQKPEEKIPSDKEITPGSPATLYQVMGVVLFIWIGLALFLFRLDRKVSAMEKHITNLK